MKRTIAAVMVIGCCVMLVGCQQKEVGKEPVQNDADQAKGYIDTMTDVNKRSRENIAAATEQQNKKNAEALEILEEGNSSTSTTMQNVPSQINMDLAKTCKSATLKTSKGDITISFYGEKAPVAVANFCTLAQKGFYDNVIFHRVIKGFMIQGGDPTGTGAGGPGYKFADELPKAGEYKIGSIAMANAGPHTNGSQFFIITGQDGVHLPPSYTLFGEVTTGMDAVTAIENVDTTMSSSGEQSKPTEEIKINSIAIAQ